MQLVVLLDFLHSEIREKERQNKKISHFQHCFPFICSLLVHFLQQQDTAAPHLCRLLSLAVELAGWYVYVASRLHTEILFLILEQDLLLHNLGNLFDFQGIGVLLNGMFGSVTGASASVYLRSSNLF
jgi:hypothetical protein